MTYTITYAIPYTPPVSRKDQPADCIAWNYSEVIFEAASPADAELGRKHIPAAATFVSLEEF